MSYRPPLTRHRPDRALDTDLHDVALIAALGLVVPLALLALVWCILAL